MSIKSTLGKVFGKIVGLVKQAWNIAEKIGVNDELMAFALKWIKVADTKYVDNTKRREFVVALLVKKGISESISRLIVEMAFQIYKKNLQKVTGPDA